MAKTILILAILFISSIFVGCAPKRVKTELDQFFEKNFEGFEIPEARWIKEGESRSFFYKTFDEIWDATILVLMQQGIMVRSSKDTGRIVTITKYPIAIFIERGKDNKKDVTVYLNCMKHLYRRVDKPRVITVQVKSDDVKMIAKDFFDKLATQVYAREKWKWLKSQEKD